MIKWKYDKLELQIDGKGRTKGKKCKVRLKWVKTKQGLRRSHFFFGRLGLYGEKERKEKRKKRRRRKSRFGSLEFMFGSLEICKFLIHVWNS